MNPSAIVIGGLNTDIVIRGIDRWPERGEHAYGAELSVGPGGKSRNIAEMMGVLTEHGQVAMVGKTIKDSHGLWWAPFDALRAAGVNTEFLTILPADGRMPGVALIPVDSNGQHEVFVAPGVNDDFCPDDVDAAKELFRDAPASASLLMLSLECPMPTLERGVELARQYGMRIMLDPGGLHQGQSIDSLLPHLFLLKPNKHDAESMSGVKITDPKSAEQATKKLRDRGPQNVLITAGEEGGYLLVDTTFTHLAAPKVKKGTAQDPTGCGDQAMAAAGAALLRGQTMPEAAEQAVRAWSLQYQRAGVTPLTPAELRDA